MPILPFAQKLNPNLSEDQQILSYLNMKDSQLETEVTNRVFGVRNRTGGYRRAGYNILRDFFEGDQWMYNREAGSAMNVTNFCRITVNNYTAFLTQENPQIDIPPSDPTDDVEVLRTKIVEKMVNDVFDDNKWTNVFYDAVQNGSLLGDSIIVGPFYDEEAKRIWFRNTKRPEYIRIIWKSEDYDEILGYLYHYYIAVEEAQSRYGDILREKYGITNLQLAVNQEASPSVSNSRTVPAQEQRVMIREIWDENVRMLCVNNWVIKYDVHNQGFVPIIYIRNIPHPTDPNGISDIEDMLDPQRVYNEQSSDMQDILKQVAFASIFGRNLDIEEIQAGVAKIYDVGDEGEVFPDPRNTNMPFLQTYLSDKKGDIDITSSIPDVFQGGKGAQNVSGRALSVLMTPINNKVRGKENRWRVGIQDLVKNILILTEHFHADSRVLIQHKYNCDVFFPGTLIRDVTEELNKFLQKTQSQYTTMKNIGIADPKGEQSLMKKELTDPVLAVEISRAPQLQQIIAQLLVARAQATAQAGAVQANGAGPTLGQDQNQGGEKPMSARGVPVGTTVSPEAAAQAAGSGQTPLIPNA